MNFTDPTGEFLVAGQGGVAALYNRMYAATAAAATGAGNRLTQMLNESLVRYHAQFQSVYRTMAQQKGKAAELAVKDIFGFLGKNYQQVRHTLLNGQVRIMDVLYNNQIIEVKNVAKLNMSQQLRDMVEISKSLNNGSLNIIVRMSTKIPPSVERWIVTNGVNLIRAFEDL